MKKLLSIFLTTMLLLLTITLIGFDELIDKTDKNSSTQENVVVEKTDKEEIAETKTPIEKQETTQAKVETEKTEPQAQEVLSAEDKAVKNEIAKYSDKAADFRKQKQEKIGKKNYDISFSNVNETSDYEDVIYKNELGDKFRYYIDTGELNYASIKSVITEKTNNSIDITDAEKIAREYVALKCNMDEYILDLSKETDQGYQFSYTRYISNYQTTDTFEIDVSFSGEISYIIDNTDIFDEIDITKITVHENWVNEKINQILSNYSGDKPELKTDTIRISVENQKVVLRFSVLHNNNVKVCIFPIENE